MSFRGTKAVRQSERRTQQKASSLSVKALDIGLAEGVKQAKVANCDMHMSNHIGCHQAILLPKCNECVAPWVGCCAYSGSWHIVLASDMMPESGTILSLAGQP